MRILFVCTGNTCRSPMAQALMHKLWQEQEVKKELEVLSAGVFTFDGLPASEEAIKVMQEYGIDITDHKSTQITEELIEQADLVLTMTDTQYKTLVDKYPEHASSIHALAKYTNYPNDIEDPFGQDLDVYRETAKQLKEIISELIKKLSKE